MRHNLYKNTFSKLFFSRPQEIDEAARRRFVKRLYIPLPEGAARKQIVTNLMTEQAHELSDPDLDVVCSKTDGKQGYM